MVAAAREAGLREVPVISVEHLTDLQIRAYRLADNQLATHSSWELESLVFELEAIQAEGITDLTILGWDTGELDLMLAPPIVNDEHDRVIEPPEVAVSRLGDLWQLGDHRLLCGSPLDERNWASLMDGRKARLCFSEPSLAALVSGGLLAEGLIRDPDDPLPEDQMSEAETASLLTSAIAAMSAHLLDGAVLQLCTDWQNLYQLQSAARAIDLSVLNLCVWNKPEAGTGSLYRSKHKLILVLKKGLAPHINNLGLGKGRRDRPDVWEYTDVSGSKKASAERMVSDPSRMPVPLVADALKDLTQCGDVVIDGFMGSGTVVLAAERTKRIAFGIEVAPELVDVAVTRWQEATGKEAVLIATGETFATTARKRA